MHILLPEIHLPDEKVHQHGVPAFCGIPLARVVFIDAEDFDILEGKLSGFIPCDKNREKGLRSVS